MPSELAKWAFEHNDELNRSYAAAHGITAPPVQMKEVDYRICPECGEDLDIGVYYAVCPNCSKPLIDDENPEEEPHGMSQAEEDNQIYLSTEIPPLVRMCR